MSEIEQNIEVEISGVKYGGGYVVDGGVITVRYGERPSTTLVAGAEDAPDIIARTLLRELVESTRH